MDPTQRAERAERAERRMRARMDGELRRAKRSLASEVVALQTRLRRTLADGPYLAGALFALEELKGAVARREAAEEKPADVARPDDTPQPRSDLDV